MSPIAPSLYAVDSAQLADELKYVDITETMKWRGSTIMTGVHHRDSPRPVTIIKSGGSSPMHLISLPGCD
jgi:hypothetical protein